MLITVSKNQFYAGATLKFLKTEGFVKSERNSLGTDEFLVKLSGYIAKNITAIKKEAKGKEAFILNANGISFFFLLSDNKIIYYKKTGSAVQNDTRLVTLLSQPEFAITVTPIGENSEINLSKLYKFSSSDYVNFPLLTEEQLSLVTAENVHTVIAGSAGSGKTNVCIDKIVFSACRGYTGKTLYTTFSRALLTDVKSKVYEFTQQVKKFLTSLQSGTVEFLDDDKKAAVENLLGVYFSGDDTDIPQKLQSIVFYLENKCDYFLIEDIYKNAFGDAAFANESTFINNFSTNIRNKQLQSDFEKLKYLSEEIIFKEIYGAILGVNETGGIVTREEYLSRRRSYFTREETETIYKIALAYAAFLEENGL
ncbi:MAG: hypothetical protein LBN25_02180, partial [Christensenellaceae bacterium]|nr:hypothetical protein [Christensenellaceae bacterium]